MRLATRPIHGALYALIAVAAAMPASAQLNLISEREELQAGRDADAKFQRQYKVSKDPDLNGMVKHLGARLAKVCERPKLGWTFRVLVSKEVNAFSVPGYVYVNTGLLNVVGDDQDALAGVIAHEIGHTTGRHAVKQMEKSLVGGLLGSVLAGRSRSRGQLVNLTENLVMLGYSRGDENDADRRAVRYTMAAGYDPEGIVRFFKKLKQKEGGSGGGIATYFRTHPDTDDRIRRVEAAIAAGKEPKSKGGGNGDRP